MLSDYQTLVDNLVRDDAAKIATTERDRALGLAVQRYSKDREKLAVEDLTPADANTLPLPAGWQADFSELRTLEFPIGQMPPSILDQARYSLYQAPSGIVVKVADAVAVSASSVRSAYTIAHVVDATHDTIPIADREAVACWAAAALCDQLASLYSGDTDSTIQADSVHAQPRAAQYAARAKTLRTRYLNELGIDDKRAVPAGTVVAMDKPDSRGQSRITHSPEYRHRLF
jgi:hypothetical protein